MLSMEPEQFNGKAGKCIKARNAVYYAFEPNHLPLEIKFTKELITLLGKASVSLGKLSSAGNLLPNPHLLILPYIKREAVLSSKIEGTRTTLTDVFLHEAQDETKHEGHVDNLDLQEVLNYVEAFNLGFKEVQNNSITIELIKKMHKRLMFGVRGESKDPGLFKEVQNWIGPQGSDVMTAKFVPSFPESVPALMENLVKYIKEIKDEDHLIKAGMLHYQFECIHPFRDGNGRLGRLLIILYLCNSRVLEQPLLYLSEYFEKNRDQYIDLLLHSSKTGDFTPWLTFFLKGVHEQAADAYQKAMRLEQYHDEKRKQLQKISRTNLPISILDALLANPYISVTKAAKILEKHYPAAQKAINQLVKLRILKEITGRKRNMIYYAAEIGEILGTKPIQLGT